MPRLPAFAPADAPSLPLHVLSPDDLPDWLAGPGADSAGWLTWAASAARLNEACSARSLRYWSWRRVGSMADI